MTDAVIIKTEGLTITVHRPRRHFADKYACAVTIEDPLGWTCNVNLTAKAADELARALSDHVAANLQTEASA